jgi:hypothetical protein
VAEGWKPRRDYRINATTTRWMSGDVNGDGRADLVHAWAGGNNTLLSTGRGTYALVREGVKPRSTYAMNVTTTRWLTADFSGDGRADLVHLWRGGINTLRSTGAGVYRINTEGWKPQPGFVMSVTAQLLLD